jgi:hypothetical protein
VVGPRVAVVLRGGPDASGLADMLHQLLEQTLGDPDRARRAGVLRGQVHFRAAEDEQVCAYLRFSADGVEVGDAERTSVHAFPELTADFLSVADLSTGRRGPLALMATGKLRVRCSPRDVPFLVGVAGVLRLAAPPGPRVTTWRWVAAGAAAAGGAAVVGWWLATVM